MSYNIISELMKGKEMRRIFFTLDCGYPSMMGYDCLEFEDSITNEELDTYAEDLAFHNAESYGIYCCDCDDPDCEEEHNWEQICGTWEEYVPEKHDMKRPGGGKWFKD